MPIRRTNRLNQKKWLKENSHLKILDLGCHVEGRWPEANHFADIFDLKKYYENLGLKFTKIEVNKPLPFNDKEFNYVILSHVLEHIPDPNSFIEEVERISDAGYIELPTNFNDSITIGNEGELGHKWWFNFDDDVNQLLISKRVEPIEKFVSIATSTKLTKLFEESFTLQLYWEKNINIKKSDSINFEKKILFLSIVKKYFSKKIRILFSSIKTIFR